LADHECISNKIIKMEKKASLQQLDASSYVLSEPNLVLQSIFHSIIYVDLHNESKQMEFREAKEAERVWYMLFNLSIVGISA